ncbi:MAG: ShlB/FhaC/HecB family hemolysin secretion/activation protein [Synechococcaceae cyanobacterium SM2_3_2]|nr:ShlB/FhaC/HecB family hemolysin secretion/activation protein [Synechococcaceae cyanobacterium SM2_3_2]
MGLISPAWCTPISAEDNPTSTIDSLIQNQGNLEIDGLPDHYPNSTLAQESIDPTLRLNEQNVSGFPSIIPEVIEFEYIGNFSVYSESELNTIVRFEEEYLGRPATISQLLRAVSRINDAYVKPEDEMGNELGYVTSGAFIPLDEKSNPIDQVQRGIIRIAIVEGRLEDVRVSGLRRLREDYVKGRILSRVRQPLQQRDLVEALQLLQLDPLVDSVSADLALGSDLGLSLLNIDIQESNTNQVVLGIDNNRSPSVGTLRVRGGYIQSNLLGFGDRFALFYEATEGSEGINDISYELPINPSGGTLGLSASFLDARIIEKPFDAIDIRSQSGDSRGQRRFLCGAGWGD